MKTAFYKPLILLSAVALASCGNNDTSTDANMEEYESTREMRQLTADSANATAMQDMQQFVTEAASDGMMEIKLAEIAMEQSKTSAVKDVADMIKSDHAAANERLKKIADSKNWKIPNDMLEKHQRKVAELRSVEGGSFDEVYLSMMEEGHKKAIDKFQDALGMNLANVSADSAQHKLDNEREESMPDASVANDIPKNEDAGMYNDSGFPDRDLRNWIQETLPVLQKHLKRVQEAQNKVP